MVARHVRAMTLMAVLLMLVMSLASVGVLAWGNGDPSSDEWPYFGVHDMTCDIALRTATLLAPDELEWLNDWYILNETDWGYSFDPSSTGPTTTDNVIAYTDDPDSYWKDWDNHTYWVHPRTSVRPENDAARRVGFLYNLTRDHLYAWMMNGSVRYDLDQHYAAYYAGLIAHYLMDVTQYGHTEFSFLDHSHPDYDPEGATYHSYYEARSWTDRALRHLHLDLMGRPMPDLDRISDPSQRTRDLAKYVSGRHGPDVQFLDINGQTHVVGSTYELMLTTFVDNWERNVSFNGARGFNRSLWDLTLENLGAGMDNLTFLWTSAYLDAEDRYEADAPDIVVEALDALPEGGTFEGQAVSIKTDVSNRGNTSTGDFAVVLYLDELEELGSRQVSLLPGERATLDFSWEAEAGVHRFTVIADPSHVVPETDRSDNRYDRVYFVEEEHHESNLKAGSAVLNLLQQESGSFNLTLENLGNRADVYHVSISVNPGTMDFFITLPVEDIFVPAGGCETLAIDVTTKLANPVGPRSFELAAIGGNSTASIVLTLVIEERPMAPVIGVEYGFYGNVSVPMRFDASGSWDHNGDEIEFTWDFGDGTTGRGAVVEHVYTIEGAYVIRLNASDGALHRLETLEVLVQDAIPPRNDIAVSDYDVDAAAIVWEPWDSSKYFSEYRFYADVLPDPDEIIRPENLVATLDLSYLDGIVLILPWDLWGEDRVYIGMETVNIYGMAVRSNVVGFSPEIRHPFREPWVWTQPSPLEGSWLHVFNVTKNGFGVQWREWRPIGRGGYYTLAITPEDQNVTEDSVVLNTTDLSVDHWQFTDLVPGARYDVRLWYFAVGGNRSAQHWSRPRSAANVPPTLRTVPRTEAYRDRDFTLFIKAHDPDGNIANISIDWGDGSPMEGLEPRDGMNLSAGHTYSEEGLFTITVTARDDDDYITTSTTYVEVTEVQAGEWGRWSDWVIAIALILFVALLGLLAGHATGYFKMGKEGEPFWVDGEEGQGMPEEEPETEPGAEPTAEEIISELETDLGEEREGS